MRLRNKKTGGIIDVKDALTDSDDYPNHYVINDDWEDAPEEPKEYWFIDAFGDIIQNEITKHCGDECTDMSNEYENQKEIGNYFETKEKAEKAVEKLKAFKRLRDNGLRFERWGIGGEYGNTITFSDYIEYNDETRADLDLLFGGEE